MMRRHWISFAFLSAWTLFAVWVGADHFDVGECVAVSMVVAGLWVVFALLSATRRNGGRSTLPIAATCGLVAFLVSFLIAPPRGGTITPRAGETYDAFIARAVQEIANARA